MSDHAARRDELIATLRAYQELCNQFEMEAAMAYFTDFEVEGDTLACFFHAESEIDRVLGLQGIVRWNRITFVGNKIDYWDIDMPSESEIARRRAVGRDQVG